MVLYPRHYEAVAKAWKRLDEYIVCVQSHIEEHKHCQDYDFYLKVMDVIKGLDAFVNLLNGSAPPDDCRFRVECGLFKRDVRRMIELLHEFSNAAVANLRANPFDLTKRIQGYKRVIKNFGKMIDAVSESQFNELASEVLPKADYQER